MTFKEVIDTYACPEGVEFCKARDYDPERIMQDATDFELAPEFKGRHFVMQGMRLSLVEAVQRGLIARNYSDLFNLPDSTKKDFEESFQTLITFALADGITFD